MAEIQYLSKEQLRELYPILDWDRFIRIEEEVELEKKQYYRVDPSKKDPLLDEKKFIQLLLSHDRCSLVKMKNHFQFFLNRYRNNNSEYQLYLYIHKQLRIETSSTKEFLDVIAQKQDDRACVFYE